MQLTQGQLQEIQAGNAPLGAQKIVTLNGGPTSGAIATKAAKATSLTGANNDITYTADTAGLAGNDITVAYRHPDTPGSSLLVKVSGKNITVHLATSLGVKATGTLTSTGVFSNDETVTIGSRVYTFKTALSTGPTVANEVLIGASAAASLDNLKSAVNATAGAGTTYSVGTLIHPTVTATTNADDSQVFQAKEVGVAGNLIATTSTAADNDFGAATLEGGEDVNQVLTTGDQIKTAIEAHTAAAALVDVADTGGNDGSGVVTEMEAISLTGGSDGKIPLFTVHGECLVSLRAYVEVAGAGASSTLVHGKTGTTNDLIASITVTNLTKGSGLDSTGIVARGTALAKTPLKLYHDGETIFATVGTAAATGGKLHYIADYIPQSQGAYVSAD